MGPCPLASITADPACLVDLDLLMLSVRDRGERAGLLRQERFVPEDGVGCLISPGTEVCAAGSR